MPDRTISSNSYRYGFNGKENDSNGEWGSQLIQDYGFRLYNPAIAKFLSVDPLSPQYPMLTPYQFAANRPIVSIDLDGLESKGTNEEIDETTQDAPVVKRTENGMPVEDLDEISVFSGPRSGEQYDHSSERYGFDGTLEEFQELYPEYQGMDLEAAYGLWLANGDADLHYAYVEKSDQEERDRINLEKLQFFTGYFYAIGDAVEAYSYMTGAGALNFGVANNGLRLFRSYGINRAYAGAVELMNPKDRFLVFAKKGETLDGFLDVIVHGGPNVVQIGNNLVGHRVLANVILKNPQFDGQAIRLLSCSTGCLPNGLAKNLANKLGRNVLAPNNLLWAHRNGKFTIGTTYKVNTGKFILFKPGK